MNNLNAVIIGATGAIGSGLTKKLCEAGVKVVAVGRDEDKLKKLECLGSSVATFRIHDLPLEVQSREMIRFTEKTFGPPNLLITSVGKWEMVDVNSELSKFVSQLHADLASFVEAVMVPIFAFNQYFIKQGGGFIVDISSHAAEDSTLAGNLTYAAAKSAVKTFIENLRHENGLVNSGVVISRIIAQLVDTPANRAKFFHVKKEEWKGAVQIRDIATWIADNADNLRAAPEKFFKSSIVI